MHELHTGAMLFYRRREAVASVNCRADLASPVDNSDGFMSALCEDASGKVAGLIAVVPYIIVGLLVIGRTKLAPDHDKRDIQASDRRRILPASDRRPKHYPVAALAYRKLKGAKYMLEHNVFSQYKPSAVFGLHNLPELPVGTVGVKAGPLMSFKDGFRIKFIGKSGHTSTPQKNVDPTVAIASLVMSLETIISRNVGPLESAVLTVCSIQSGTPFTTTIDDAEITGNIRSLEEDVRERILKRVELMAHGTAEEFGCACELELIPITRGVFNSESLLKAASDAGAAVFGVENVKVPSVNMASEDFSLLCEGVPSFFYFLGSGVPGEKPYLWHNPMFHAAHDTPACGAALLAQSVFSAQDNL